MKWCVLVLCLTKRYVFFYQNDVVLVNKSKKKKVFDDMLSGIVLSSPIFTPKKLFVEPLLDVI